MYDQDERDGQFPRPDAGSASVSVPLTAPPIAAKSRS